MTSVSRNTCEPAARIATVFVGDGIERDAPALGERRPQLFFRDTAIVGRAASHKRRREQLLAHLVGRGEATVEIEDDRFGYWPVAFGSGKLVA